MLGGNQKLQKMKRSEFKPVFVSMKSWVMKYILIWVFLNNRRHTFLCVSLASVPRTLLFSWLTMSLTGPFVLHYDCCCCIMWSQEQYCEAESQAQGETSTSFHFNSPPGSHGVEIWTSANRQTLLSAVPCLSALNNPGSSSLTLHRIPSFSSASLWPPLPSASDTRCCCSC